jgi:hypothetical protein
LNEQASVRRLQMDDVTFTFVADGPNDLGHRSGSVAPAGVASAFSTYMLTRPWECR